MHRGWVLATAAVLLFPSLAQADSDGYYCIGPGFVAYELSFSGGVSGHWLHIVRVSAANGIVRLPPIALPEFQVHGMTCQENGVDLDGWTTGHSVSLDSSGQATVTSSAVEASPKGTQQQNLGMAARPGVTDIPSDGFQGEFQLVIAEAVRTGSRGLERFTVSQIWRRALTAPVTRQVTAAETLFVGVRPSEGSQLDSWRVFVMGREHEMLGATSSLRGDCHVVRLRRQEERAVCHRLDPPGALPTGPQLPERRTSECVCDRWLRKQCGARLIPLSTRAPDPRASPVAQVATTQ